jgi:hypothetical protein
LAGLAILAMMAVMAAAVLGGGHGGGDCGTVVSAAITMASYRLCCDNLRYPLILRLVLYMAVSPILLCVVD